MGRLFVVMRGAGSVVLGMGDVMAVLWAVLYGLDVCGMGIWGVAGSALVLWGLVGGGLSGWVIVEPMHD